MLDHFEWHEPVTSKRFFVGRTSYLDDLCDNLRSTLFIGEEKIGKTSLLKWLGVMLPIEAVSSPALKTYYIDLSDPTCKDSNDVVAAVTGAFRAYIREVHQYGTETSNASEISLKTLKDEMRMHASSRRACRIVLLLDNLDRPRIDVGRFQILQTVRHIVDHTPEKVELFVLAAASNKLIGAEPWLIRSSLVSRLRPMYMQSLSYKETTELVSLVNTIDPETPAFDQLSRFVYERTGGHPYLVQKLLSLALHYNKGEGMLAAARQAATSLAADEENLFHRWIEALTLEELTYLQALALRLRVTGGEWSLPLASRNRLMSTGLVKASDTAGLGVDSKLTCGLFADWLRAGARRLIAVSKHFLSHVCDVLGVVDLFGNTLRSAVGKREIAGETELQKIIAVMLAAHELDFVREAPTSDLGGKDHIADFFLKDLDLSIEVKLVRSRKQISGIKSKLIEQIAAYKQVCSNVVVVIYDLTGTIAESDFYGTDGEPPGVYFVVVRH